jgi:hypothetical protein
LMDGSKVPFKYTTDFLWVLYKKKIKKLDEKFENISFVELETSKLIN